MKRKIIIDDNLEDIIKGVTNSVTKTLKDFVKLNPSHISNANAPKTPCLYNDLDYDGTIHQIVDQAVPIYDQEIKALWYLYDKEFEKAYENAGVGDKTNLNWRAMAIYFYIYERLQDWYKKEAPRITKEVYKKERSAKMNEKLSKISKNKTLDLHTP